MIPMLLALFSVADEWSDFEKLSKSKDFEDRCKAIDRVDKHKDLRMAQALLPLLGDEHPRVRYRAMRALGRCKEEVAGFVASKGLKHSDARVRQGSAESLGWMKVRQTVPALLEALGDSQGDVRAEACSALGWIRDDSATARLLDTLKDREGKVQANVLEAVVKLEPAKAKPILAEATAHPDYRVRMEAAKSWPIADAGGALEALPKLLQDKDWRVRCAGIEACLELRERACVGWLIGLLESEKGRLRWDALVALKDLTAKEIGLDVKGWKTWWEANKDSFEVAKKNGGGDSKPDVGKTVTSFFKVPILSTNIIFILDLSGSMRDKAVDGEGQPKGNTKLDVAKKGMTETIKAFPPETRFSILALGSTKEGQYDRASHTWQRKLVLTPAAPPSKADAEKWVNKCEAKGWTNIWDGLEYAFENPDVDTIYLYSDGGASKGVFVLTDEILAQLQKMNRFRKIMIHTIEVPAEKANTKDNIRLLTELAVRTKGVYKLHGAK